MSRRKFLLASATLPVALGVETVTASSTVEASIVDIGFCQDMTVHHLQALSMCRRVIGRDTGGAVQAAATEVLENQAMEIGQMRAWLADWGASTVPPSIVMGWMCGDAGSGMPVEYMPGYATKEQLRDLSTLEGIELGRRWLELMRAHHVGGVMMASLAEQLATSTKVLRLARLQVKAQTFEISQYDQLLLGAYANS